VGEKIPYRCKKVGSNNAPTVLEEISIIAIRPRGFIVRNGEQCSLDVLIRDGKI
jgi:hypothetical protein